MWVTKEAAAFVAVVSCLTGVSSAISTISTSDYIIVFDLDTVELNETASYLEANDYCNDMYGTDLYSLHSTEQRDSVVSTWNRTESLWFGFGQTGNDSCIWKNIDGTALNYTGFLDPMSWINLCDSCAMFFEGTSITAVDCEQELSAFVCNIDSSENRQMIYTPATIDNVADGNVSDSGAMTLDCSEDYSCTHLFIPSDFVSDRDLSTLELNCKGELSCYGLIFHGASLTVLNIDCYSVTNGYYGCHSMSLAVRVRDSLDMDCYSGDTCQKVTMQVQPLQETSVNVECNRRSPDTGFGTSPCRRFALDLVNELSGENEREIVDGAVFTSVQFRCWFVRYEVCRFLKIHAIDVPIRDQFYFLAFNQIVRGFFGCGPYSGHFDIQLVRTDTAMVDLNMNYGGASRYSVFYIDGSRNVDVGIINWGTTSHLTMALTNISENVVYLERDNGFGYCGWGDISISKVQGSVDYTMSVGSLARGTTNIEIEDIGGPVWLKQNIDSRAITLTVRNILNDFIYSCTENSGGRRCVINAQVSDIMGDMTVQCAYQANCQYGQFEVTNVMGTSHFECLGDCTGTEVTFTNTRYGTVKCDEDAICSDVDLEFPEMKNLSVTMFKAQSTSYLNLVYTVTDFLDVYCWGPSGCEYVRFLPRLKNTTDGSIEALTEYDAQFICRAYHGCRNTDFDIPGVVNTRIECLTDGSCSEAYPNITFRGKTAYVRCENSNSCPEDWVLNGRCLDDTMRVDIVGGKVTNLNLLCPQNIDAPKKIDGKKVCRLHSRNRGTIFGGAVIATQDVWEFRVADIQGKSRSIRALSLGKYATNTHGNVDTKECSAVEGEDYEVECSATNDGTDQFIWNSSCDAFQLSIYDPMSIVILSLTCFMGMIFIISAEYVTKPESYADWANMSRVCFWASTFFLMLSAIPLKELEDCRRRKGATGDCSDYNLHFNPGFHICAVMSLGFFTAMVWLMEMEYFRKYMPKKMTYTKKRVLIGFTFKVNVQLLLSYIVVGSASTNPSLSVNSVEWVGMVFCVSYVLDAILLCFTKIWPAILITLLGWMINSQFSPLAGPLAPMNAQTVFSTLVFSYPTNFWGDIVCVVLLFGCSAQVLMLGGRHIVDGMKILLQMLDFATDLVVCIYWALAGYYWWTAMQVYFLVSTILLQYWNTHDLLIDETFLEHVLILSGLGRGLGAVELWSGGNPRWRHLEATLSMIETMYESYPSMFLGIYLVSTDPFGGLQSGPIVFSILVTANGVAIKALANFHFFVWLKKRLLLKRSPNRSMIIGTPIFAAFFFSDFFVRTLATVSLFAVWEGINANYKLTFVFFLKVAAVLIGLTILEGCLMYYAMERKDPKKRARWNYSTMAIMLTPCVMSNVPYWFGVFGIKPLPECVNYYRALHIQMVRVLGAFILLCVAPLRNFVHRIPVLYWTTLMFVVINATLTVCAMKFFEKAAPINRKKSNNAKSNGSNQAADVGYSAPSVAGNAAAASSSKLGPPPSIKLKTDAATSLSLRNDISNSLNGTAKPGKLSVPSQNSYGGTWQKPRTMAALKSFSVSMEDELEEGYDLDFSDNEEEEGMQPGAMEM